MSSGTEHRSLNVHVATSICDYASLQRFRNMNFLYFKESE